MTDHPIRPDIHGPVGLCIRAARPADAEGITVLANLPGFRAGTLRPPFQTVEETRAFIEQRRSDNLWLVAELDGRIVGSAGLERFAGRRSHVGEIGMGVHDDHTGCGIGKALLAALLDAADNWIGLVRVQLTVYTDNAPAIALYKRFGFEVEGTLRAFALRAGRYTDALAMARLRPPPPLTV
ncbi:MAG TPA: GNAT family N-acetyltransferase [Azospirillaceae bacterium]|nr:GNAT family N-acetyltransferase [Azospirillaceae bacterium]